MKNILIIGIMMLMLVTTVLAQGQDMAMIKAQNVSHTQVRDMIQERIENQSVFDSTIVGLERARLLVTNEIARQSIERNIEKMNATGREILEDMNDNGELGLIQAEENKVIVQGKVQARLFNIIPLKRTATLVVDEAGEVTKKGRALDFLYRYEEKIKNIPKVE